MTDTGKKQIRLALMLAAYWGVVMVVSLLVHRALGRERLMAWPSSPPFLLYGLALFLPIAVLLIWRPVFLLMESWPIVHRTVLLAFLGAVFLGHSMNAAPYTFPFMDWQMFTRPFTPDTITHFRFTGACADGSEIVLNPVRLFPPLDNSRFYVGFRRLSEILSQPEHTDSPLWNVYDEVLLGIAQRHNQKYPEQPVVSVRVDRIRLTPAGAAHRGKQVEQFRLVMVAPELTP